MTFLVVRKHAIEEHCENSRDLTVKEPYGD